ncbi:hypothetical protein FAF44_24325 [Nonomuraea sp. MG754425]|uniref:hypothetical protein n=1 Tax=Nonomuraea sp. MG754425 TaxID=2570319 RepID=UPI001F198A82|nr:hypothetical protein [Nonomuraea sp. MG754425]MCF6471494.1 hypothetical protein [Nonomuraea sp. MG754425]
MARSVPFAPVLVAILLAGCGSSPDQAAAGDRGSCPLTAQALAEVTDLRWELKERLDEHPLETAESIKAMVCLYTAADAPQEGSDPLTMRVDLVEGADSAVIRKNFTDTCAGNGGEVRDVSGARVCDRNGSVVEGQAGTGERAIDVYWVNADTSTATRFSPVFPRILAAVSG